MSIIVVHQEGDSPHRHQSMAVSFLTKILVVGLSVALGAGQCTAWSSVYFPFLSTFIGELRDLPLAKSVETTKATVAPTETIFELYVLAQSWQPAFCQNHFRSYPGCARPKPFWRTHFTLHGLWPQYDETHEEPYPSNCPGPEFNTKIVEEIGEEKLEKYWPDVKFDPVDKKYTQFWRHEWSKHGTCSGLGQLNYTMEALRVLEERDTPLVVQQHVGETVAVEDIMQAFGGVDHAVLQCERGGESLLQVFTCWERKQDGFVGRQVACPHRVLSEGSCRGSRVVVKGFK